MQLGEHGVCNLPGVHSLPIQPAISFDTKVHGSLSPLLATTLEDLGHNQGGTMSTNWVTHIQLVPTQGCQDVMCAMPGNKVSSWQLYASDGVDLLCQEQCSWVPTKSRAVLWRQIVEEMERHSRDVSEVFGGIDTSRMLTVITTTQTNS